MKFIMLIDVKMPTIVGILKFISIDKCNIWEFESNESIFLSAF